ncbi:probable methyltransferase-like protein 24 [Takifugu flavidus]|uniref:Methyltransferase domain-containing protein n=2 Tax=Takifugu TaxID=31032 RepID=A0A5C6NHV9_9TELE|nr:probable methyltransferase-like protein 24 [Takifugu flavidus]TWW65177.1 hypothetical protein D4764_21G0000770 [Takifugu flavidus]
MCFVITEFSPGVERNTQGVREERGGGLFSAGLSSVPSNKSSVSAGFRRCRRHGCPHGGGMRTCARWWRRDALPLRSLVLLVPPFLLTLQLLVIGPRLPRTSRPGSEGREGAIAFSVINIDPGRNVRHWKPTSRRPLIEAVEGHAVARAYEDENEMLSRKTVKALKVMPWAADKPSFSAELSRILAYITRPQLNCSRVLSPGQAQASQPPSNPPHWLLCAEDWLFLVENRPCVAYSFSMDRGDAEFLRTVSLLECEVHRFDPSNSNASGGHPGNSLASNHGDGGAVSRHKTWLEWRAPKNRRHRKRSTMDGISQTLADIIAALGHRTVDFLYVDLLSAEWRVFQNWIESGTLQSVHHLVATIHLQWAGFEVGGTDEEVLRYWFSVLQGLQASGLKLVHSSAGEGHNVLKRTTATAHSSYTLSWVNTRR